MAKKWADPLDKLLEADEKARSIQDYLEAAKIDAKNNPNSKNINQLNSGLILDIDVKDIIRWKYKDRPENELGDIEALANSFKTVGQQQPCILRPSKEIQKKYELIIGERRWHAAQHARLKLKATIVNDLDDKTAALIQAIENEKRADISDFAKGMSYANKIEENILTQKDLVEILGISKQQISRLLSYKKIPEVLFNAIEDFRKVSSRTAYELVRLSSKSEKHTSILVDIADKIRDGKYGQKRIEKELENQLSIKKIILPANKKVIGNNGRHLFTWRLDNNQTPSIHFPKDIINLISNHIIDFDRLSSEFKDCLAKKLSALDK